MNGLAKKYGLATQYYANTHPSIGNHLGLTTGADHDNNDSFNKTVTADNVVRDLLAAGKTWTAYEESLPRVDYTSPDIGNYVRRYCPLSYFSDVINSSTQKLSLVPFTQFKADLANNAWPNYSFMTPNLCNDAHDCSLGTADSWLKTNIDSLVKSASLQNGGLLIIVLDEAANHNSHGGGQVAWVAISPKYSKGGLQIHYAVSTPEYAALDAGRSRAEALSRKRQERNEHVRIFQVAGASATQHGDYWIVNIRK